MIWDTFVLKTARRVGPETVREVREAFVANRPRNLDYLLRKRFGWMNEYVEGKANVVELGAGLGFSKLYITNPKLALTDILGYPWIDKKVDALQLGFEDESMDVIICSHVIHHLAYPVPFFESVRRALKPGGLLLVQELESSWLLLALNRLIRNEGWSYKVDVFAREESSTHEAVDPWAANIAIPHLLFSSSERFEKEVPGFKVLVNEMNEGLLFPLSGGVLRKVPFINLPLPVLRLVDRLDERLVRLLPGLFATGRRVVLEKRPVGAGPSRGLDRPAGASAMSQDA